MIRSLIKIAIVAVIAIIGYNYFFGDEAEKKQSQEIIKGVGDIGVAAYNLIQDEIQKAKDGKYDGVVNKIQNAIDELRASDGTDSRQLDELQQELNSAKDKIQANENDTTPDETKDGGIKDDLSEILKRLKDLDQNN